MRMRKTDPALFLELTIKAAQNDIEISSREIESLIASNSIENARLLLDALGLAKKAGLDADLKSFQPFILAGGDIKTLMESKILADNTGLKIDIPDLTSHYLSRGNIRQVVESMNIAKKAKHDLSFDRAAAIDLAGHNLSQAVQTAIIPQVIQTEPVTAVTKNGFKISACARITIETNLENILGGAGKETILSRASESLAAAICSAETHSYILENTEEVSDNVWKEDMDEETAHNILSLELTNIEILENIGEKQRLLKAEADVKIAHEDAKRKEQEVRIKIMETRARLMEEEAKIPSAMLNAFSSGKLGISDYYKLKKLRTGMLDNDSFLKNRKKTRDS